ncbi:hypothetical protein SERLADRAFT_379714 [Serpula lacrymans var. lacrymans S7.9]|uniref:Uncharacterized protein n=1 Tax=Serpula lacrymans var. lacrymans (strain S7.9) TaxID=578457 RepID=F8NJI4_SERL9|nr:uncharacterized protein SERLADRAFT_379714 [Serpula lacrymans var. lacrymans S7.9]EGO30034.1 hypothetical protein SERLADRAFT_379714 [Serpula lacrymans var. lacrymans S7.9]
MLEMRFVTTFGCWLMRPEGPDIGVCCTGTQARMKPHALVKHWLWNNIVSQVTSLHHLFPTLPRLHSQRQNSSSANFQTNNFRSTWPEQGMINE